MTPSVKTVRCGETRSQRARVHGRACRLHVCGVRRICADEECAWGMIVWRAAGRSGHDNHARDREIFRTASVQHKAQPLRTPKHASCQVTRLHKHNRQPHRSPLKSSLMVLVCSSPVKRKLCSVEAYRMCSDSRLAVEMRIDGEEETHQKEHELDLN